MRSRRLRKATFTWGARTPGGVPVSFATPLTIDHRRAPARLRPPLDWSGLRGRVNSSSASRAGALLWSIVNGVAKLTGTPPGVLAPHVNVAFRKRRERSEA